MPSLASLAGKRDWFDVSLMTAVGGLAKYFGHAVDVTGAVWWRLKICVLSVSLKHFGVACGSGECLGAILRQFSQFYLRTRWSCVSLPELCSAR
jgi:hypothetical protein